MDTRSHEDPVEPLYDARIRGVCLISTRAGSRMHLHGGCWLTAAAHRPPRLLVAFPKEFEGAELVRRGGAFALSLLAEDQAPLAQAVLGGATSPTALPGVSFRRLAAGCPVLEGAVAHFLCSVEGEFGADADYAGFYGPVSEFSWGRREAPQLRADQLRG